MKRNAENKMQPMPNGREALILRVSHSAHIPGDFGDDAVNIWTCELLNINGTPLGIEPMDDDMHASDIDGREARFEYVITPAEIESGEFAQGDMTPPALRAMIEDNFAELAEEVRGL